MVPRVEVIALNRLAFGPRPGDVEALSKLGFEKWLDEQLSPDESADTEARRRISQAKLRIKYDAGKEADVSWPAVDEERPLSSLDQPIGKVWHLTNWDKPMPYSERNRPFQEVRAATWLRAVYSKWQLREVMVDFWHNHFNVGADSDVVAQVGFPAYDRDVIRKYALGNFREFIEAVAKSVPMLRYLNNSASKASPANENYARELFELHTLGSANYLNHLYNRWRDVPGAIEGKPAGYIDQDVYEAARAFTGWTFGHGQWARDGDHLPNTGEFMYFDPWHDNYQKRVLGVEFDPNQPPMADGRRVLDLLCAHPATAIHVCRKLCRRLVADDPPEALVTMAAEVWTKHASAPDQIAQVVRAIALSESFRTTWGQKVKRPLEFIASLLRGTGSDLTPDNDFIWNTEQANQKLFNWPAPDGHPDQTDFWLSASTMVTRWKLPVAAMEGWFRSVRTRLLRTMPSETMTCRQITEFWVDRMLGYVPSEQTMSTLLEFTSAGAAPDQPLPGGERQQLDRVARLVELIGMTPEFHMR